MNLRILFLTTSGILTWAPTIAAAELPAAGLRPAISGIANVGLDARDLNASRPFYRDYLGFTERPPGKSAEADARLTWFKVNDRQQIELRVEREAGSDRLRHVGLITSDAEGMRRYLQARGHPVPPTLEDNGYGDRSFTVRDPDGRAIQFVQYPANSWATTMRGPALSSSRIAPRIRHAGFMVADLAASLKFYQDILGFTEFWRGSADDQILSWVNLKVPDGDEYFELMLYDPANPPNADRRGTLNHICLEVHDAAATEHILQSRTLPTACQATSALKTGRNGKRQINSYDPDGTRTELMEPTTVDGRIVPSSLAPLPYPRR